MIFKKTYFYFIIVAIMAVGIVLSLPIISDAYAADDKVEKSSDLTLKIDKVKHYDIAPNFYYSQAGKSSWYGRQFHNRKTSSGEKFDMYGLSAAHRYLPLGSIIRVTNLNNNKSTLIRVNDCGPFVKSKIIDLSYTSADELNALGNPEVKIESLLPNDYLFMQRGDEEYYFGYSFELPLVCLPSDVIKFLDSSDDFNEAVEIYRDYLKSYPNQYVYLMVEAADKKFKTFAPDQATYYIGLFDSDSYEVANDLK